MTDTDVAIIGAGPIGLTLANLLGRRGHRVHVLERRPRPYDLPRAIHFDAEAMRCFQATGLADEILAHTHVGRGMLFKDAAGRTLVDWSRGQTPGPMGWCESYRFYQPGLEDALRHGLDRFDGVRLERGAEVVSIAQGDTVTLTLADGRSVTARYAIGADGAQSLARQSIGAALDNLGFRERWLVADLLLRRPRPDLGDHTIQHCDPESPATYARGAGGWRRWEIRLAPGDPDTLPEAEVWRRLARWITPGDATLRRAAVYTFRSAVATRWRDRRVMIAGDAAHQMPPFMGQGMCAGVRDAANLCWKLSAVLQGAAPALLDTYQSERESNVRQFIEQSVALGKLINRTAAGKVPKRRMQSIWPDLGPGLGPRDGVGGALAPQVRTADGTLADDAAQSGFYVLAREALVSRLPVFTGAADWLAGRGLLGVVVRPDGYALGGFGTAEGLGELADLAARLGGDGR